MYRNIYSIEFFNIMPRDNINFKYIKGVKLKNLNFFPKDYF